MKTLLLQCAGGILGGLALAIPAAPVGLLFGLSSGQTFGEATALTFGLLAYTIGLPVGIDIVSRRVHAHGSLWLAVVGSFLGSGLFCAGASRFAPASGGYADWPVVLQFLVAMLPPLAVAVFAYNRTDEGNRRGRRRG